MQTVPESIIKQELPHQYLRFGIPAFDPGHVVASGLFVVNVSHEIQDKVLSGFRLPHFGFLLKFKINKCKRFAIKTEYKFNRYCHDSGWFRHNSLCGSPDDLICQDLAAPTLTLRCGRPALPPTINPT